MQKIEKLKENRDFRRLYYHGKSCVNPYFVLYLMKGRTKKTRIGITAGKALGGAVERNRAKRVITAAFRSLMDNISPGYDFVIVARTRILKEKSTKIAQIMEGQFKNVGIWCEKAD
ncbi:MAG: ribonuclease P protein component [Clostridia bacterium]|nr:ribonuclease P protein component [Clostridia bacterium]